MKVKREKYRYCLARYAVQSQCRLSILPFRFLTLTIRSVRSAVSRLCQRQKLAARETTRRNTVRSNFVVNQTFQVSQYVCSIENWRNKNQWYPEQQRVAGTKEVDAEDDARARWGQQPRRYNASWSVSISREEHLILQRRSGNCNRETACIGLGCLRPHRQVAAY